MIAPEALKGFSGWLSLRNWPNDTNSSIEVGEKEECSQEACAQGVKFGCGDDRLKVSGLMLMGTRKKRLR